MLRWPKDGPNGGAAVAIWDLKAYFKPGLRMKKWKSEMSKNQISNPKISFSLGYTAKNQNILDKSDPFRALLTKALYFYEIFKKFLF